MPLLQLFGDWLRLFGSPAGMTAAAAAAATI